MGLAPLPLGRTYLEGELSWVGDSDGAIPQGDGPGVDSGVTRLMDSVTTGSWKHVTSFAEEKQEK